MKINITIPNTMHIGVLTQPWEYNLNHKQIGAAVQLADTGGFHKALLGEHFIVPNEHTPLSGGHYLHSAVALGVMAGQTENIQLGSSLSIIPLQNPIIQAKAWASLDWLSGGRAVPMFGVGWMAREFDMLNVAFNKRGALCEEFVQAMIVLWTQEKPIFEGEFVSFNEVTFEPRPIQTPMPVWFGGDAEPMLKRIARYGHGWQPFQVPPEKIADKLAFIKDQPEYDGRPIDVFLPSEALTLTADHSAKDDAPGAGNWDVSQTLDTCVWLASLGVTQTTVSVPPVADFAAYLDRLRWVAEEIIPKASKI